MRAAFYFDDNIAMKPVVQALRDSGIEVVTPDQSGNRGADDEIHLQFAARRGLAIVTSDEGDFSVLHWTWVSAAKRHGGIIVVRQRTSIGDQVRGLKELHSRLSAEELQNSIVFLSRFL